MNRRLEEIGKKKWLLLLLSSVFVISGCCCFGGLSSDDEIDFPDLNRPPTAVLAARAASQAEVTGEVPFEVTLDGSASTDPDGMIVDYAWDFDGDGTFDQNGPEAVVNHTYELAGTFTVTLRVTDDDGATDTDIAVISVGDPQMPPTAAGSASVDDENPLLVTFDASASTDLDGVIVQYDWDFDNDGTFDLIDGGVSPSHEFPDFGTFTVTVRVTDDDGNTDTAPISVTLTDLPSSVTAAVTATPSIGLAPLEVEFDASGSTSENSNIVQYDWDLDDNGSFEVEDGGPTQTATYENLATAAAARSTSEPTLGENGESIYTITVRVSDDKGNTDTASATVTVDPPLEPPVAAVTATPAAGDAPLEVELDASGSTDSDGTIETYDWDFDNDGTFDMLDGGATLNHTYDPGAVYTALVRVTDNDGLTDTATVEIDVNNPPEADLQAVPASGTGSAPEFEVTFDATGSTDSDGTIETYDWDMDDDGTFEIIDGAATQTQFYNSGGIFPVTVRVTDDDGAQDTATLDYDVNEPPVGDLQADPANGAIPVAGNLDIQFDASGSTDNDGTIDTYNWDLDGDFTFETPDGGPTQTINVTDDGTYTVNVEVVDNDGATGFATASSTIVTPPVAVLTASLFQGEGILWDASASFDNNGTIVRYDWDDNNDGDFDDPEDIQDGMATYEDFSFFGEPGETKTVRVMVTDDDGLTDETTHTWTVPFWPEAIIVRTPEADANIEGEDYYFTDSILLTLDGSTSFDLDGTIEQYDWDLDGDFVFDIIDGPATLTDLLFEIPGEDFSASFQINLRVFDNDGLEGFTSDFFTLEQQPG